MRETGVQPADEDYMFTIRGWAKSNELWHRVRDGSVDRLLRELSDAAFELSPTAGVEPSIAGAEILARGYGYGPPKAERSSVSIFVLIQIIPHLRFC